MTPILINGTEYYRVKQVRNELAKRDKRCKRLENDLVKCRREIARLQANVDYFETGCVCSRNYKHLEKD